MNVVVQNHYSFITTNGYLFTSKESDIGYNLLKPWNDLFLAADERGIKMYTPDQFNENEADLLILMDYPSQPVPESKRTFFLIYEPDMLIPKNWNKTFHDHCDKVFTWDDRLVDNHKYFKHNFTADLQDARPLELTREQFMLRKPIVLMQTRKQNDHPNSLYGKRDNIIRFFEGKASGMFDLWGRNWGGFPSWRHDDFIASGGHVIFQCGVLRQSRCASHRGCVGHADRIRAAIMPCATDG